MPAGLIRWFASLCDGRATCDIFPTFYRINSREAIHSLPGFDVLDIECLPTGPLLHKIPLLRSLESLFMQHAHHCLLHNLQADWIALLRKSLLVSAQAARRKPQSQLAA